MLLPEEIEEEKNYLAEVIEALKSELKSFNNQVKEFSDDIKEQMSYAWDKTNRLSDTEFVYALANIQKRSVYAENANKKVRAYTKMLDNTYFARIDFDDDETGDHLPIYIGISTLSSNNKLLVFDWRAPISSMFYNHEIGRAFYTISTGEKITGNITLKRQYKIKDGQLQEVFDTDMQILDNVLKEILSSNASNKMKNIVTTIQKEQNEIIRKRDSDIFVVQGPAGSGKTSIAMHKIAYLLYAERDKIDNSNVMIISPNEIFNNYISDVLPGIGEENVVESTFMEFAKNFINEFKISSRIEDIYEIIYAEKSKRNYKKINELKFKYDTFYKYILNDFIKENMYDLLSLEPIVVGENAVTILSENEIKQILKKCPDSNESLYLQGKKIVDRLFRIASTRTKKQLTLEKLKKEALGNLVKIKIKAGELYQKLYQDKSYFINFVESTAKKYNKDISDYDLSAIFDETNVILERGLIEFQDVTPFMFLKARLIGMSANKRIRYVLIDEAQDYSLLQYEILSRLFKNSNITLLGDLNQSILPFNTYSDYNSIIKIIEKNKITAFSSEYELTKTYRSTYEINAFAKKVISYKNQYNQIDRHGDDVIVKWQENFNISQILEEARNLKQKFNTVAIICKNTEEVSKFAEEIKLLEDKNSFRVVAKNDSVFVEDKIMIIPSYLSKGLEFDAVLISNANNEYYTEDERNLFYVVLTRALHKLEIFYTGKFTELYPDKIQDNRN